MKAHLTLSLLISWAPGTQSEFVLVQHQDPSDQGYHHEPLVWFSETEDVLGCPILRGFGLSWDECVLPELTQSAEDSHG